MGGLTAIRKHLYEKVNDGGWLTSDQENLYLKRQLMVDGWLNSNQKKQLYEKVSDSRWLNSDQIKHFYENIFRAQNVLAAAKRFPQKK